MKKVKLISFGLLLAMGLATVVFNSCGDDPVLVTGISLDKATHTLAINEDFKLTATLTPSGATDKTVIWTSDKEAIAKVDNTGKVTSVAEGTAKITAKAGTETATCEVTVKGVRINGVVWATRNVGAAGAFAGKPEEVGSYYQWNRKKAWASTGTTVTGWDSNSAGGTVWEKANDPSPTGWRVPTKEEIEKLVDADKVTIEKKTENGVNGRKFTDKVTGNSIFLPAAGYRTAAAGSLTQVGTYGRYWGSTQYDATNAYVLRFTETIDVGITNFSRSTGLSVRPVADN